MDLGQPDENAMIQAAEMDVQRHLPGVDAHHIEETVTSSVCTGGVRGRA